MPDNMPFEFANGWVNDPEAVDAVVSQLPYRSFADTPAHGFSEEMPDHCYLWDFAKKATGALLPPVSQGQIGSCVSFGTNRAIEYTMCVQIAQKMTEEFHQIAQEVTYGGSRVEVGGGKLGRGDGSIGAWAAKFVKDWGVVARGTYGKYDLSKYNESTCREFGKSGVPSDLEAEAKKHPVKETVMVINWEQAKKALVQGYGIAICSDHGFSMKRSENGIAKASGSWAHCMSLAGWATIGGEEYGRIDNSWGPSAHTGPVGPGEPGPEGFYAHWKTIDRMLGQKDSFAFSCVEGFPLRKIHWNI